MRGARPCGVRLDKGVVVGLPKGLPRTTPSLPYPCSWVRWLGGWMFLSVLALAGRVQRVAVTRPFWIQLCLSSDKEPGLRYLLYVKEDTILGCATC